jgi:hypothetical protein
MKYQNHIWKVWDKIEPVGCPTNLLHVINEEIFLKIMNLMTVITSSKYLNIWYKMAIT